MHFNKKNNKSVIFKFNFKTFLCLNTICCSSIFLDFDLLSAKAKYYEKCYSHFLLIKGKGDVDRPLDGKNVNCNEGYL